MRGLGVVLLLTTTACSVTAPAAPTAVPTGAAPKTREGHYLVELNAPPQGRGARLPRHEQERRELAAGIKALGVEAQVTGDYRRLWNGVALRIAARDAARLKDLPSVRAVFPVLLIPPEPSQPDATLDLYTGLEQTHADIAQSTLGLSGAGIRVGIIDTGADLTHPDLGGCFGPGCRMAFGWDFVGDSWDASDVLSAPSPDSQPNDCLGHGTHVTGIVGANGQVRGVAPAVTFGIYRVFSCLGASSTDVTLAAMDRAFADGMRVVNLSLGSAFEWPQYPTAVAANALVQQGVVVVASAGNSGAGGLFAVGAPGSGAQVLSVGSVNNTTSWLTAFTVSPDDAGIGYYPATAAPPPPLSGTVPLVRTGTPLSPADGCAALPVGSLSGSAALIHRGGCTLYDKAMVAADAGAAAVVLYNNVLGPLNPSVQPPAGLPRVTIPVVGITAASGNLLDGRVAAGAVTVQWGPFAVGTPFPEAGLLSFFSSWGPTAELTVKPDLVAPGSPIFSTFPQRLGGHATLSGTSMASPHVAGAAALVLEAQPSFSVAEIQAALLNTARAVPWPGDLSAATAEPPVAVGAGLVQVDAAALTWVTVTPPTLALGESQGGPQTRTLTFTNHGATPVTFSGAQAPVAVLTGTTRAPVEGLGDAALVTFGAPSITVPALGSATLSVSIAPAATASAGLPYGGRLSFTAPSLTLSVPFVGFAGDYQAAIAMAPMPELSRLSGGGLLPLPSGGTFTLQGGDTPWLTVHFEHYVRRLVVEARDPALNKTWGTAWELDFPACGPTSTFDQVWTWDGSTSFDKSTLALPNGDYVLEVRALKALGDEANASDWETWTSPLITLSHP